MSNKNIISLFQKYFTIENKDGEHAAKYEFIVEKNPTSVYKVASVTCLISYLLYKKPKHIGFMTKIMNTYKAIYFLIIMYYVMNEIYAYFKYSGDCIKTIKYLSNRKMNKYMSYIYHADVKCRTMIFTPNVLYIGVMYILSKYFSGKMFKRNRLFNSIIFGTHTFVSYMLLTKSRHEITVFEEEENYTIEDMYVVEHVPLKLDE